MNIQEYVFEKIIKYMNYKDDEIQKNKNALSKFGIKKCERCENYSDDFNECDFCHQKYCNECNLLEEHPSWNLSGLDVCENCIFIYCIWCYKIREKCCCKNDL